MLNTLANALEQLKAHTLDAVAFVALIMLVAPFVAAVVALVQGNAVNAWGTLSGSTQQWVYALALLGLKKYVSG